MSPGDRDPVFQAYLGLCLTMPNGRTVRGRVIEFTDGLELLELLGTFQLSGRKTDFQALFTRFLEVTGLAADEFQGLQIRELCAAVERFLSHERSPSTPSSPEPTPTAAPLAAAAG
jgi:hypothetical protein